MYDKVLGELTYDLGWVRLYRYSLFGREITVRLTVAAGEGATIEETQRQAFAYLDANIEHMSKVAEEALFTHYQSICVAYRATLDPHFVEARAPFIQSVKHVGELIEATAIRIPQSFGSSDRRVGLIFLCSWDPELELSVTFLNEEYAQVDSTNRSGRPAGPGHQRPTQDSTGEIDA